MEIFIYIFAVVIGAALLFLIIEYPYYIAGLVIFMMVYRFNIETPLPLDARGLLTLVLFIRLYVFDKKNASIVNFYLPRNIVFWIIVAFSFVVIVMPVINSERFTSLLKDILLNLVVLVIGFLVLIDDKGKKVFMYSIIVVSLISSIDLIYTYIIGGGLNVVRVIDIILRRQVAPMNHNFPGMLSSLGLFFIYLLLARKEVSRIPLLILGVFFLSALILSTSRSGLLALIIVFILMNFIEVDLKENIRKFVTLGVGVVVFLIVFFFTYNLFLKTQSKNQFVDKIYYRLIDEPLQIFGMSDSKNFDIYSHKQKQGSMKFRAEKWAEDFNKFQNLSLSIQGFGLGPKRYSIISKKEYRHAGKFAGNLKRQLNAHNGYLIILIERGVLGLMLYLLIVASISISAFKVIKYYQLKTPVIYLYLFIAFYSFAQNSELVGIYAYLLMGGVLGNIYSANHSDESLEEEIEEHDQIP